ncbi:MAG: rane bound O-acyl transferase family protein [Bacteroidetes bacterium]|nr:rane bound O-acyl transferase family protein [Bacteroidota bacterium]
MLFNSLTFLAFFPVVTSLYFMLPHKFRWLLLLIASCFFYMFFKPVYILILFGTIIIDYYAGIKIENASGKKNKKLFLILSLIANIGVLAVFKYYNFINHNITDALVSMGFHNPIPFLNILLPIGLSFHTFQAMSYTIEVYRGNQKAERHFGIYALYVMFYPQLVAGPIERPQNVIHQFREVHTFQYSNVSAGLKLMLWGFFKKVVIADRLAIGVDEVYNHLHSYSGVALITATAFFAIQIYCDFSGYSDIALGTAKVMGFTLMTNFDRPYASRSISEFWTRWHISLSSWFRDYLYIPLGGNRVKIPRLYFNLFIVFMVSGLWHGADWTFIIWGALHGLYLIIGLMSKTTVTKYSQFLEKNKLAFLSNTLKTITVFCLVTFAWLFFRAKNFDDAMYVVKHMFDFRSFTITKDLYLNNGQDFFIVSLLMILFMETVQYFNSKSNDFLFAKNPSVLKWSFCIGVALLISVFGVFHRNSEFIYFQF